MNPRFSNKTALVTGAANGIGRAIAIALANQGCRVTAADCSGDDLKQISHTTITAVELDVTQPDSVVGSVQSLGQLDILVNAAGTIQRGSTEMDPSAFQKTIDVNLTGTHRLCTACHALLKASKGCIVNLASLFSQFGAPHAPGYSASKGGVVQLTKSLAAAWAVDGIRVNALMPGWIDTQFTKPIQADPERNQTILDRTPLGRWGRPEEIADAALFLVSPEAAFITGAVLPVDGGYSVA